MKTKFSLILVVLLLIISSLRMNAQSTITEFGTRISALLEFKKSGLCASGFFIVTDSSVCLITAKHFLFNEGGKLIDEPLSVSYYTKHMDSTEPTILDIDLGYLIEKKWVAYGMNDNDYAVIKLAKIDYSSGKAMMPPSKGVVKSGNMEGALPNFKMNQINKFANVFRGDDVLLFGYPTLARNKAIFEYPKPLLRKGIISGKNLTNNTIIIDCFANSGNSGGPVLEFTDREYKLIGIVTALVTTIDTTYKVAKASNGELKALNDGLTFTNSGYSIVQPIDKIIKTIEMMEHL